VPFTPVTTISSSTNGAEAQVGDTTKSANSTSSSSSSYNSDYLYLLFLLIIPLVLIILLIFCCCCGRYCQIFTHKTCNFLLCPCARPKDSYMENGKVYDATICYSEYDENWLDEQFLPCMSQFVNNYKIHKLSLFNRSTDKISRENEKVLRSSKRIILIFSRKFLKEEWSNKSFRNVLRDICMDENNKNFVLIVVNVGALPQTEIDYYLRYLDMPEKHFALANSSDNGGNDSMPTLKQKNIFLRMKDNIKYHLGLKRIETLQIADRSFWKRFLYIMPQIGYDNTKPTVITKEKTNSKAPKRATRLEEVDEYASEYKDVKSLRHIIVPIPDFMRTQLGFNKKSKKAQLEDMSKSVNKPSSSVKYDYNQQDYDVNKRINGFSAIPYSPTSVTNDADQFSNSSRNYHKRAVSSRSPSRTNNISIIDGNYKIRSHSPSDSMDTRSTNTTRRNSGNETPDILASFKPDPNMVIKETPMRKTRSSSRQKSPEKYDRSDVRSSDRTQRRRSEDSLRSTNSSRMN
jgi:hypothetical protein